MANTPNKKITTGQASKIVASKAVLDGKPMEEIVWTALPNGISKGAGEKSYLKLSVFVAPRLRVADAALQPRLASFADFLDWPARARALEFDVQFGNGPKIRAVKAGPEPDNSLWTAMFKSTTKVESFTLPEYYKRPILDYPVIHVHDYLKTKYQNVGVDPRTATQLPTYAEVAHEDTLGRIALAPHEVMVADADLSAIASVNRFHTLKTDIKAKLAKTMALPHSPKADPEQDFARLAMVHEPFVKERVNLTPPELDFHSALSSLAKYPHIMRLLGLVIDLEIELTAAVPQSATVKVMPDWGSLKTPAVSTMPRTAYTISGDKFLPAPNPGGSDVEDGLLRLDSEAYEVITLDVDAAATSNMATANNATHAINIPNSAKESEPAGLPALRTGGISLVRSGRAEKTHKAVTKAYNMYMKPSGGTDDVLYADDVMRGFRVDVWDSKSKSWNSLCRRNGTYRFLNNGKEVKCEDEGFVSSAVTKAPQGSGSSDETMRIHQSMFTWNGWSLCAQRPGKTVTLEDKMGTVTNDPPMDFRLKTSFSAVKGSLPKLRYGNTYRLRARAVDLAGNSLGYDEPDPADFSHATGPTLFGRFEPVASPVVVQRVDPKAGSIHAGTGAGPAKPGTSKEAGGVAAHITDWGSPGESVEHIVIRSFNANPAKDKETAKQTSDRHIAPPRAAQLMAETHGMFDVESGVDKTAYQFIKEHDAPLKEVEPAQKLDLPYLADPAALGANMTGLPGTSASRVVEFYPQGTWPEAKPFRLKLAEGNSSPQWDASARVLTVFLPKAEVAQFKLSSKITEDDLKRAGVWHWLEQTASGQGAMQPAAAPAKSAGGKTKATASKAKSLQTAVVAANKSVLPTVTLPNGLQRVSISKEALEQLKDIAERGQHWMITPSRTITLVHAVQQPLMQPKAVVHSDRALGDTGAALDGKISIHPKSTSKVELVAQWDEPVDPVSEAKWRTISGKAQVAEFYNKVDEANVSFAKQRHEFHDTKYRKVRYHATATTRFREYFSPAITADPARISRSGPEAVVDVLSSARPAAPKVLYVVPTFGWKEPKRDSNTIVHERTGGGLRVYLDRPWFSSGEGELLGVVLSQQGAVPSDIFKPYITMWGIDPIWDAKNLPSVLPQPEHFTAAVDIGNNLSISEIGSTETANGQKVCVAGHKVEYDEERRLWYSDIVVNAKSAYMPFIRLALARYQPKSVANAHLSRIALAEYAQLVPDRTLLVDKVGTSKLTIVVRGSSVYTGSWLGSGPSEIEAELERKRPALDDDELAWLPVATSPTVLQSKQAGETTLWTGQVSVPAGGGSYRVIVKEYERYAVDKPFTEAGTGTPDGVHISGPVRATDRRLVYADALELD